jgi:hypothetical protein
MSFLSQQVGYPIPKVLLHLHGHIIYRRAIQTTVLSEDASKGSLFDILAGSELVY